MLPITPFDESPKPPFEPGAVPRAGWFNVDVCGKWPLEPKDILSIKRLHKLPGDDADPQDVRDKWYECITQEAMDKMIAAFDAAGKQVAVTADHSFFTNQCSSEAYGWIGALHRDGDRLWAWIEWTDDGHPKVNGKSFIDFSGEHQFAHYYKLDDDLWAPARIDGMSLTNYANHQGKTPITNTTKPTNMKTSNAKKATKTNACPPPEEDPAKTNSEDQEQKDTNTNSEDPDPEDTKTNDEAAYDALEDIADLLGLDDTATIETVKSTIQAQIDRIKELEAGLAAANETATNSKRYPNMFGSPAATRTNSKPLKGEKPNAEKAMKFGGREVRVNSQDIALADYCQAAVDKEETKLGRNLNASEYNEVYGRAYDRFRNDN